MKIYPILFLVLLLLAGCRPALLEPSPTPEPLRTETKALTFTPESSPTYPFTATATIRPSMTPRPTFTEIPFMTNTPHPTSTLRATRFPSDEDNLLWVAQETVLSLLWYTDSLLLLAGTDGYGLASFDMTSKELVSSGTNEAIIQAMALSPDERYVAAALGNDGSIRLLNAATGFLERTIFPAHDDIPQAVAFGPNSDWLASCAYDGKIKIWDVETGELINTLFETFSCTDLVVDVNTRKLIVGFFYDEMIRVWNIDSWQMVNSFPADTAEDLAVSPDGTRVVSATGFGQRAANVWDVNSGNLVFVLDDHPSWVWAVAYSPDGKYIATGGVNEFVYLWDANSGQILYELFTGTDFIQSLEFSPDSSMLAAGGAGPLYIWDLADLLPSS
jgi:WD40 repeat protein